MLRWLCPALHQPGLMPAESASADPRTALPTQLGWLQPAMQRAGLDSLLSHGQGLTLLAPDHAALQQHLAAQGLTVDALMAQPQRLRALLLEHLLPLPLSGDTLQQARPLPSLGVGALRLQADAQGPCLIDAQGHQARLLAGDLRWGALRLHLIDRVLQPPTQGLLALLQQAPSRGELAEALHRCGLEAVLRASGPFTLLAPSDQGFKLLAGRLGLRRRALMKDTERLGHLLRHHLLGGRWLSHELPWGGRMNSAQGLSIDFSPLGLVGSGNAAQPLQPGSDRQASNGVLHLLAAPLLPAAQGMPSPRTPFVNHHQGDSHA